MVVNREKLVNIQLWHAVFLNFKRLKLHLAADTINGTLRPHNKNITLSGCFVMKVRMNCDFAGRVDGQS
jgi:hypothetical protein